MKRKVCFKCGKSLPLSSFYKHPMMKDGRLNKCKECNKNDVRKNRAEKIDYYQEYDRQRSMRPDRVRMREEYQKTGQGKASVRRAKKKWTESNVVKRAAHIIVNNAVRDGKILKPEFCSVCGNKIRLHGHHDDYAKPLEVRWLCSKCHTAWHRGAAHTLPIGSPLIPLKLMENFHHNGT